MPSPLGHAIAGVVSGLLIYGLPVRLDAAGSPAASGPVHNANLVDGDDREVAPEPAPRARAMRRPSIPRNRHAAWLLASFAVLGMLPDVDFAVGAHSMYTHSVGATLAVLIAALTLLDRDRPALAVAMAAAYGSHPLLDWLGHDTSPPIGIMALWPFSNGFYQSSLFVFDAIDRRYWRAGSLEHNIVAISRELAILAPMLVAAMLFRAPWITRLVRAPRNKGRVANNLT